MAWAPAGVFRRAPFAAATAGWASVEDGEEGNDDDAKEEEEEADDDNDDEEEEEDTAAPAVILSTIRLIRFMIRASSSADTM